MRGLKIFIHCQKPNPIYYLGKDQWPGRSKKEEEEAFAYTDKDAWLANLQALLVDKEVAGNGQRSNIQATK